MNKIVRVCMCMCLCVCVCVCVCVWVCVCSLSLSLSLSPAHGTMISIFYQRPPRHQYSRGTWNYCCPPDQRSAAAISRAPPLSLSHTHTHEYNKGRYIFYNAHIVNRALATSMGDATTPCVLSIFVQTPEIKRAAIGVFHS